jgi:membrane associated rhomboid family serine protease
VACWAVFKTEPSAKGWGIAASLMYILIFFRPIIFSLEIAWWRHLGALFTGIVGLVEFSRRDEPHDSSKDARESADYGSGIPRL